MLRDTPQSPATGSFARPGQVMMTLATGVMVGLAAVVVAISAAANLFSGDLEPFASSAAMFTLLGTAAAAAVGAVTLTYRGAVLGPMNVTAATLSLAASSMAAQWGSASETDLYATIVMLGVVASGTTGLVFLALGVFRLGSFARFIPYPVIGGFLAGTGVLLVLTALAMSTGRSVTVLSVGPVLSESAALRWVPALGLALAYYLGRRLSGHPLVLPVLLAASFAGFYAVLALTGTTLDDARALGLLLSVSGQSSQHGFGSLSLLDIAQQANYGAIVGQVPAVMTVVLLATMGLLMSAAGMEHTTRREVSLNREFVGAGLANLAGGAVGGLPSYHYMGATTLAYALHLRSAAAGLSATIVALVLVFAGSGIVANLPMSVLAGLTGFIGLSLVHEWLIAKRNTVSALDYGAILLIVFVMVAVGFVEGVAVGLTACVVLFVVSSARQDVVVRRFSTATHQSLVERTPATRAALQAIGSRNRIFELSGHLFFGTANRLYREVARALEGDQSDSIVLDFRRVHNVDSSAVYSFEKIVSLCEAKGAHLVVTGLRHNLENAIGLHQALEAGKVVVFDELDEGMEWAENQLLKSVSVEEQPSPNAALLDFFKTGATEFATRREIGPGTCLVRAGEPSDGYFIVEEGELSVTVPAQSGLDFRLRTVGNGALIGEVGHYNDVPRTTTVAALTNCVVWHMSGQALRRMEDEDIQAAMVLHRLAAVCLAKRLNDNTMLLDRTR